VNERPGVVGGPASGELLKIYLFLSINSDSLGILDTVQDVIVELADIVVFVVLMIGYKTLPRRIARIYNRGE